MTTEVLSVGREPRKRWRGTPWLVAGIVLALLTGAAAVISVEFITRTVEMNSLVRAIERSEGAMVSVQDDVTAALEAFDGAEPTPEDREELRAELRDIAARGEQEILAAGIGVADVRVLPWHRSIEDARRAYLAHNEAWVAYMAAAAEDPAEMVRPQPLVNETFIAAEIPLYRAVPRFDPTDLTRRIAAIYAEDEPGSGDGPIALGGAEGREDGDIGVRT